MSNSLSSVPESATVTQSAKSADLNSFIGARSYEEKDRTIFFGREDDVFPNATER